MRVILAGPDGAELTGTAYPAFAVAGVDVEAVASTPDRAMEFANLLPDAVLVVDAGMFPDPAQALEALRASPNPKVVILPSEWGAHRTEFAALPGLVAGFTAPVSWPEVVAGIRSPAPSPVPDQRDRGAVNPVAPATAPVPSPPPAPLRGAADGGEAGVRRALRVGFWGTRGGVGTSTAALTAARLLADAGRKVLLCDATGRGDLHLMLNVEPQEGTVQVGENLFVRLGLPDGAAGNFNIIIDGGRSRRDFNAEWVEVSRPIPPERIRRILGLPPAPREGKGERERAESRGRKIGFIRLEVTE